MSFSYTRQRLLSDIDQGIQNRLAMLSNKEDFINQVVREVNSDTVIRSTRRKTAMPSHLFHDVMRYPCPTDLYDHRIIDFPTVSCGSTKGFSLVPVEQFRRENGAGDVAIETFNGQRSLLINAKSQQERQEQSLLDSPDNWIRYIYSKNVRAYRPDHHELNSGIAFDLPVVDSTYAGIQNSTLPAFDLTPFLNNNSYVFVWAKIPNAEKIVALNLHLGNDETHYYETLTQKQFDGTKIKTGWNLFGFPLPINDQKNMVDNKNIQHVALFYTKDENKKDEVGYVFADMSIKTGSFHEALYYSNCGWQTTAGAWAANSTSDLDLLVADHSEYGMFVQKGIVIGLSRVNDDLNKIRMEDEMYQRRLNSYNTSNPDESQLMISTY